MKYMLDKISQRIMEELCHDGRLSNAQLAQMLDVGEVTVARKIKAMIDEGIIEIKGIPNPTVMGYQSQAFIGLSVNIKKIDSVCNRLKENTHVNMITTSLGRYDILLIAYFRDPDMLHYFIKGELPSIDGVNHVDTYFILDEKKPKEESSPEGLIENKLALIDELDRKIITELIRNGRPNYADLANKLGISKPTVSRRIAFLLKERLIRIVAIPNPSKLGFLTNAYVLVNTEYTKIDDVLIKLGSYPEVHLMMRLMNDFDILLGIYSVNHDTLYEFLKNKIWNIDGILKTDIFIRGNYHYFSSDAVLPFH